jgi:hypothetical protein
MAIKYKILEKDTSQHSVVVRYYTDIITEDSLATSFTTDSDGNTVIDRGPDGSPKRCQTDYNISLWNVSDTQPGANTEAIFNRIYESAPYDWFELKEKILDNSIDTTMSVIDSLIGSIGEVIKPVVPTPVVTEVVTEVVNNSTQSTLSENEIELLIQSLVNNTSSNSASSNT